ncbi:MAG: rhodanese-like domain-containing protein, partial [Rhizobiaceae bacterium]
MSDNPFLVTPEWLAARLGRADVAIVDASWYLPAMNRDQKAEYAAGHIPGAVFFDIDAVADTSGDLPHMLPSPQAFADWCGRHGIAETDSIVVYDGAGVFSAPRAWWTFRVMGARQVFVLDGGTPAWTEAGHALTADASRPLGKTFRPAFDVAKVADS